MAQTTTAAGKRTVDQNGNPTLDHPDVATAYREDFSGIGEILDVRGEQETRDGQTEAYRCDGGDHSFRVYLTNLPRVYRDDLEVGLLLYKPVDVGKGVYEITGEPYRTNRSWKCPTVWHFRDADGDIDQIQNDRQFVSHLVDKFTVLQA